MTENDCSVNFKLNYKLFIVLSVISLLILYSFYRIFKYIKIPLLQCLIIDTPITSLSHFEYLCNKMVLFSSVICYDVSILKF